MIDLPRSTCYYLSTAKALNLGDSELVAIIEDIQDELPCYGYRRVTHELRRRGHLVNHKRVARVMRANGLGRKPRKRYVRTTDSNHDSPICPNLYRNVIPSRPDMVWAADFTYSAPRPNRGGIWLECKEKGDVKICLSPAARGHEPKRR
jgi:putative transposase